VPTDKQSNSAIEIPTRISWQGNAI